ncbi:MAG: zinc ribbon domain-containing protein [Clostridia bacterium]|nr:zinc ribbon domain-containing protein [Clostridia bacterium]
MRKLFAVMFVLILLLSLVACGKEKADKYCWSCGKGISKDVSFCSYCGASVKNNEADASTEESSTTSVTTTTTTASTTTTTSLTGAQAKTTIKKQQATTTQRPTTTTKKATTTKPIATTKKATTTTQLADSITVLFPNTPIEINTINFILNNYRVSQTMRIDKFYYEIGALDYLWLYCSGEKTYDIKGANSTSSCEMNWRLYDLDGYLIDSGWFFVGRLKVGDKFKDQKINISLTGVKAGESYRLEVSDCSYE